MRTNRNPRTRYGGLPLLLAFAVVGPRAAAQEELADPAPRPSFRRCTPVGPRVDGLLDWEQWWEGHRERFLADARRDREHCRAEAVPALRDALAAAETPALISGCLMALARLGDPPGAPASPTVGVLLPFLGHEDAGVVETATLALGVLGDAGAAPVLEALLADAPRARARLDRGAVPGRLRVLAALALGLVGEAAPHEAVRCSVVQALATRVADSDQPTALRVACVQALGLVPLAFAGSPGARAVQRGDGALPESLQDELALLRAVLEARGGEGLVRAHAATALGRLAGDSRSEREPERESVARALLACLRAGEAPVVARSAVLALGALAAAAPETPLARRVRHALLELPRELDDPLARLDSSLALARAVSASPPSIRGERRGRAEALEELLERMRGDARERAWAALACGLLARGLGPSAEEQRDLERVRERLRSALRTERDAATVRALCLAVGLARDLEAQEELLARLDGTERDLRGYAALGLGLMGASAARDELVTALRRTRHSPTERARVTRALSLLEEGSLATELVTLLRVERASVAPLCDALALAGDGGMAGLLVDLLLDHRGTELERAAAARALGHLGDRRLLAWNALFTDGANHRALVAEDLSGAPVGR